MTVRKLISGWFETSFWVDCHYALAALGTLVIFWQALHGQFNVGFGGFDAAMWTTAFVNDKVNMPPVGGA